MRQIEQMAVVVVLAAARAYAQEAEKTPRIIVSIPDRKLAVIDEDGEVVKIFQTAVGAAVSPSPTGTFQVVNRLDKPTYYHPGVVIPPGKGNPLGTRWLGLNVKGFGIHGTNVPRSIGRAASHGCIRMRNRDIEELFEMVKVGDIVELRGERDEELASIFDPAPATTNTQVAASSR